MANYACSQRVAQNPLGIDQGIPTHVLVDGDTFGAQCATDVKIGYGCFYSAFQGPTLAIKQTSGGTDVFAGVVMRSNASPMDFASSLQGYSTTIQAGYEATVLTRASVPVPISVANESGAVPIPGSAVYVVNATGLFQSQTVGGSAPSGCTLTNFRIKALNPAGWSAGGLCVITNVQNVGA